MSEAVAESPSDDSSLWVGGSIETPAYALLDGMLEDERVTVPIARLPALLGRTTGDGPDPDAASLGKKSHIGISKIKTLSREHIRIDYRTKLGTFSTDEMGRFLYRAEPMKNPPADQGTEGFYLLTCLGKNPITVNGQMLKRSEHAVLHSGSTIKVHGLRLYFLLPTEESTDTIPIPTAAATAKRKAPKAANGAPLLVSSPVNTKKPKLAKSAAAAIGADKAPGPGPSTAPGGWPTLQSEIDCLKTSELLRQIDDAIEADIWERRHQLIGSTVSYRAVMEAAKDPDLIRKAEDGGSVGRGDIMRWISESPKFGTWVRQMHTKLEEKSYQASITKALVRAGFERTANTGRYIKWHLPSDKDQGIPVDDDDDNDGNGDDDDDAGGGNDKEDNAGDAAELSDGSTGSTKVPGRPRLSIDSSPESHQGGLGDDPANDGLSASGDDDSTGGLNDGPGDDNPTE